MTININPFVVSYNITEYDNPLIPGTFAITEPNMMIKTYYVGNLDPGLILPSNFIHSRPENYRTVESVEIISNIGQYLTERTNTPPTFGSSTTFFPSPEKFKVITSGANLIGNLDLQNSDVGNDKFLSVYILYCEAGLHHMLLFRINGGTWNVLVPKCNSLSLSTSNCSEYQIPINVDDEIEFGVIPDGLKLLTQNNSIIDFNGSGYKIVYNSNSSTITLDSTISMATLNPAYNQSGSAGLFWDRCNYGNTATHFLSVPYTIPDTSNDKIDKHVGNIIYFEDFDYSISDFDFNDLVFMISSSDTEIKNNISNNSGYFREDPRSIPNIRAWLNTSNLSTMTINQNSVYEIRNMVDNYNFEKFTNGDQTAPFYTSTSGIGVLPGIIFTTNELLRYYNADYENNPFSTTPVNEDLTYNILISDSAAGIDGTFLCLFKHFSYPNDIMPIFDHFILSSFVNDGGRDQILRFSTDHILPSKIYNYSRDFDGNALEFEQLLNIFNYDKLKLVIGRIKSSSGTFNGVFSTNGVQGTESDRNGANQTYLGTIGSLGSSSPTNGFYGTVAQVMVFNKRLSDQECSYLMSYFSNLGKVNIASVAI